MLFKSIRILALLVFSLTACAPQPQADQKVSSPVDYRVFLGKSLTDKDVAEFIVGNNCSSAGQYQLCKDRGLAFWTSTDQILNRVYLYSGNSDGFRRYTGKLPYGLSFYDPMWRVEEKIKKMEADDILQHTTSRDDGSPDTGSTPDHLHYWAVYERFNMVVIYDSPFADEDAYIYAVLVNY